MRGLTKSDVNFLSPYSGEFIHHTHFWALLLTKQAPVETLVIYSQIIIIDWKSNSEMGRHSWACCCSLSKTTGTTIKKSKGRDPMDFHFHFSKGKTLWFFHRPLEFHFTANEMRKCNYFCLIRNTCFFSEKSSSLCSHIGIFGHFNTSPRWSHVWDERTGLIHHAQSPWIRSVFSSVPPTKNPSISPILHAIITLDFSKHQTDAILIYIFHWTLFIFIPCFLSQTCLICARGAFTQIEILLFRLFILSHHIAPPLRGQNDASFMRHFVYTTALLLAVLACYDTFFCHFAM